MRRSAGRIEAARERTTGVKRRFAAASVVGLVGAVLLARVSHPGHTATRSPASTGSGSVARSDDPSSGLELGSGSLAPSGGSVPQVQSSGS